MKPRVLSCLLFAMLVLPSTLSATKDKVLYSFTNGSDGGMPTGTLLWRKGNLYGITSTGGASGNGVVFELKPSAGIWKETVIYSFSGGHDGGSPQAGLTKDGEGNLYGTTRAGGGTSCFGGCGVVFRLSQAGDGTWTQSVLYRFKGGMDGANPTGRLALDEAANLYGATQTGADKSCNCGTIFQLKLGSNGQWGETVLHAFTGGTSDGANPFNMDLILNGDGQIFGTTVLGGAHGIGTVFELSRDAEGRWNIHVLHSFQGGDDGANPSAGTILLKGHLYGTTYAGGNGCANPGGCGTVYELTHLTDGHWTERILHRFHFTDGDGPTFSLLTDKQGDLYGTVFDGGSGTCSVCGTAYELTPSADGTWKESMVYHFGSYVRDAGTPFGGLIRDKAGNLFGTTEGGGAVDQGTVYEITP